MLHTITFIALNILFLVVLKIGINGYLLSMVLSNAITILYLVIGAKLWRYILPPQALSRDLTHKMLKYSVPMIPNSLSWWVSNSSDKYMLTFFCVVAATGVCGHLFGRRQKRDQRQTSRRIPTDDCGRTGGEDRHHPGEVHFPLFT